MDRGGKELWFFGGGGGEGMEILQVVRCIHDKCECVDVFSEFNLLL